MEVDAHGDFDQGSAAATGVESLLSKQSGANRVVVEWGPPIDPRSGGVTAGSQGTFEIMIRYKCDAFPSVGSFFLLLYNDPFQSELHEVVSKLHFNPATILKY